MKYVLNFIGSLPAVFVTSFFLTYALFTFFDNLVESRPLKHPRLLRLFFCIINAVYVTFAITLYDGGTPTLYLLLLVNIADTLEHAYMSKDRMAPYISLGSGAFLNYLMGYMVIFSIYRMSPLNFWDVESVVYQRGNYVVINFLCAVLLLVLLRSNFPIKEIREVIHGTEIRLLNMLLPIHNIMMFLFGVTILPMVHAKLTARALEIGFYTCVLGWAATSMMTWWVIIMYQANRVKIKNTLEDRILVEQIEAARFKDQADRNPLTGLYNRRAWAREVKAALRAGENGHLVVLDLDHFKEVNDNLGHQEGDRVLQETADMLRQTFRKVDIIGHIGGDEFCVFMQGDFEQDVVNERMDHLMELRRQALPYKNGGTFWLSISGGYAPVRGGGNVSENYTQAVAAADAALYWQKEHGRNGYVMWRDGMGGNSLQAET